MSRHTSEPPADWLPSSEEDGTADYSPPGYSADGYPPPGYPAMPDYPPPPGYPQSAEYPQPPGYQAAGHPPPGPGGPSIAHDEYRHGGPYGQPPEEYGPAQEAYSQPQQAYDAPHQPYGRPQQGYGPDQSDYGQASGPPDQPGNGYGHPYEPPGQPPDTHPGDYAQAHDDYSSADYGPAHSEYPSTAHGEHGPEHGEYPPTAHGEYGTTTHGEYSPAHGEYPSTAQGEYSAAAHSGYGQPGPGYGQAPTGFGSSQPGYGVVPADHRPPLAGELPALPEPDPDTTAALRRIRPDQSAPAEAASWPEGPDAADARWTMLGYLTVPLFGFLVPLAVYLRNLRGSNWTRAHAAQALNVWITVMLYNISAVIMGTMLALDSPHVALIVFAPLILVLWLVTLTVLVRAATAASEGRRYDFPRWLCSRIFH